MGAHYGSIHVRVDDATAVRTAVESLASTHRKKFLVGPAIKGWVTVFPEDRGQDFDLSAALAQQISVPILHCFVYDDDIFSYQFYEAGKPVDTYNSCPDYFGDEEGEAKERGGNAELLKPILPDAAKREELAQLLKEKESIFEGERLEKFATLLGLPNAVSSYEYLQDGERDGIQKWKLFVHIPDPTPERTAARAAKVRVTTELARLSKEGWLILDLAGEMTSHPLFHSSPVWCLEPITGATLLGWAGTPIGPATPTRLSRINPRTGESTPTSVEVTGHLHRLAASSRWIAAGCACGDWKTQIWNVEDGSLVTEVPQSRAVEQVGFSQDGETLFSLSEQTLTVIHPAGTAPSRSISLPDAAQKFVLHPAGEYLAIQMQGLLGVVHLPSGTALKSVWIPEPSGPTRDLMEHAEASGIGQKFLSAMEAHIPKDQLDETRARMARHCLPKQSLVSLSFGSSGNYLFCGTTAGLCVLEWEKILTAADQSPVTPLAFIKSEDTLPDDALKGSQRVMAVTVDSPARRILFADQEGKVRFANTMDNRIGDLLASPVRGSFYHLELSPDRSALVGTLWIPHKKGNKQEPSRFQIWNYPMLCQAAGLAW